MIIPRDMVAPGAMEYWEIADEFNDGTPGLGGEMPTLEWFDPPAVALAEKYAVASSLPWPPPVGMIDFAYESKIGPFSPKPKRTVAWDRDESDPCERSTPGCSIHHPAGDEEPCETW